MLAGLVAFLAAAPAKASTALYFSDFNSQQSDLVYEVYQGGVHEAGNSCDTDACATFGKQGQRTFGEYTVNPSLTPGFYQNVAAAQTAVGTDPAPTNQGPLNVSYGHPITLEAKVKWGPNYSRDGQTGNARGTSGVILWNGAVSTTGQTPDYSEIGFTWASKYTVGGILSGFTANSFVDLNADGIDYPPSTLNINDWFKIQMVWSQDANGVQTVAYYADGTWIGTDTLQSQLHGLSLEIWNDNQEPVFCDTGLCESYPNPTQSQSFFVDYVSITQA